MASQEGGGSLSKKYLLVVVVIGTIGLDSVVDGFTEKDAGFSLLDSIFVVVRRCVDFASTLGFKARTYFH